MLGVGEWKVQETASCLFAGQLLLHLKVNLKSAYPFYLISAPDRLGRDEAQLIKLRQLGMTAIEEAKLLVMRDYILKLAAAISRYSFSALEPYAYNVAASRHALAWNLKRRNY